MCGPKRILTIRPSDFDSNGVMLSRHGVARLLLGQLPTQRAAPKPSAALQALLENRHLWDSNPRGETPSA